MTMNKNSKFLFPLGQVVATPAALEKLRENQQVSMDLLYRHQTGDWGVVDDHDRRANEQALQDGGRIWSAYLLKDGTKVWVITTAAGDDGRRESTCILLPGDY